MATHWFVWKRIVMGFSVTLVLGALPFVARTATATIVTAPAHDLYETQRVPSTYVNFLAGDIPMDFFESNSDPLPMTTVNLQGVSLGLAGNADTIVRRNAGLADMTPGMIPIEIVALHLVSVNPITVTYNGGATSAQWDVSLVIPAMSSQSTGPMNALHVDPQGGTFSSSLPVKPLFTFTKVSGPSAPPVSSELLTSETLMWMAPWSHTPSALDAHNGTYPAGNFYAGVDPTMMNQAVSVTATSTRFSLVLLPASVPEPRAWLMLGVIAAGMGVIVATCRAVRGVAPIRRAARPTPARGAAPSAA